MNPLHALRDMRTIKQLLTDAEGVAREMGDEEPGAEHLLVAAIGLADGSAARVAGRFGFDGERLRQAIADEHAEALSTVGVDTASARRPSTHASLEPRTGGGVYRSSPSAREAFQAAGAMARSARQRFAGAHVVAAVARMEHGTLARVLARLGVDRHALEIAAAEELRAETSR